jgi:large subunit ribosomal protein L25
MNNRSNGFFCCEFVVCYRDKFLLRNTMTESNIIIAETREDVGKGASRRLRHLGKVPAVIYGGKKEPATLTLEHDPLMHAAEQESFYSSILEIRIADGRNQQVVVRDVHHHPFKPQIMHLDFLRVSAQEILRMSVPIHYIGEDESEAGKVSGLVIQHLVTEIEIAALPANLPEYLDVDLSGMEEGDVILLTDIKLPEGVEIPALAGDGDEEIMIANTIHIKESQGTGAAAEAELEAAEAGEEDGAEVPTVTDSDEDGEGEGEDEAET